MGLFGLLANNKEQKLSEELSAIIMRVSIHECSNISELLNINLLGSEQVLFFLEYSTMLISIADRLSYKRFGDPFRNKLINRTVDIVKDGFCSQTNFGRTEQERGLFYEKYFNNRFGQYANCSSIMGDDNNQIVFTGAINLTENIFPKYSKGSNTKLVLDIGKSLTQSVLAIMSIQVFKKIS